MQHLCCRRVKQESGLKILPVFRSMSIQSSVKTLHYMQMVIRCDLAPFLGLLGLQMLFARQIPFARAVVVGVCAAAVSLVLSIGIDSILWQNWLWPEGAVLWFNTAENRCRAMPIYLQITSMCGSWIILGFHWSSICCACQAQHCQVGDELGYRAAKELASTTFSLH